MITYSNIVGNVIVLKNDDVIEWERLKAPSPSAIVFEEIDGSNAKWKKNMCSFLILPRLWTNIPLLKQKADDYDNFTVDVLGFTRAMVVVSDLIHYINTLLARQLNVLLNEKDLGSYIVVLGANA